MDAVYTLAGSVWNWAQQHYPDDPRAADMAVSVALSSYAGGASLAEACEHARAFAVSWSHHPGHNGDRHAGLLSVTIQV